MAPRLGSKVGYEPIPVSLPVALEFLDPTNGSAVNDFVSSVWKPKKPHSQMDRIKEEASIMIGDDADEHQKKDKKSVKKLYREASTMEVMWKAKHVKTEVIRGSADLHDIEEKDESEQLNPMSTNVP